MTDEEIRKNVKELLEKNLVSGYSKTFDTEYHYMKPSPGVYPYQYFWDTCFHVYIMTALGMNDMAKKCIASLFAMQEDDGFVGHMLYWKSFIPHRITDIFQKKPAIKNFFSPHMTAFIQPPLPAQAVLRIYKTDGDKEFVKKMLPKLKKYYRWIAANRDFEGKGLISIISYFEAGMDWKPSYDAVIGLRSSKADWKTFLKVVWIDFKNYSNGYNYKKIYKKNYFIVKDAGINTIYAQNLQALASLCELMNDPDKAEFTNKAEQVRRSIVEVMYDEKDAAFYDVYGKENIKLKVLTPTIFFPVIIEGMPEEIGKKVIETHLFNKSEFDVAYPIPSVAINHPAFNPNESMYIWRGPTWVVYNWFLHQYLMEKGYRKEATRIVESIKELIRKSGFREYYNPFTGEGYGAKDFTWSGLVVDMMNMEEGKAPETFNSYLKNQ
ncbi:MAG: trehalase-like protein [Cytophagaceae bacterium]|nr:trehalase-like protein [Cytophagaceae bacterium]